jgi:hypothetical protein
MAAALLAQEFPFASLDSDGTLFTVVIYGVSYSDVIARIRAWMTTSSIGPVLVTDEETAEELLSDLAPRRRRSDLAASPG